jgi:hypothetical protein
LQANTEKQRLEHKQRAARKAADRGDPIRPRWFEVVEGQPSFRQSGAAGAGAAAPGDAQGGGEPGPGSGQGQLQQHAKQYHRKGEELNFK